MHLKSFARLIEVSVCLEILLIRN